MPILKEAETNKTKKGKAKADSKRTNLNTNTSLWCKLKDVKKMDGIFADQEDTVVEKEVDATEAEVVAEEEEEIVVYTRPLQVASPTQTAADDAGAELGTEEQFDNRAKPKEKKRKCSRDKKMKERGEETEEKKTSCSHIDGCR
ncbi:hypothetical protein PVK06_043651 [Gossypium arboreum]|uniref:Uncharacterized protein n=1 Tax=Gossypium arboreum TaxID=29729 RepID=A0ABR0MP84_GOSAR|nr:hypothetical protein PVK06_043651 [Gossypium arboreum]